MRAFNPRRLSLAAMLLAAAALAACDRNAAKGGGEQSVAQALDACGPQGGDGLLRQLCGDEKLAALNGQINQAIVAEAADVSGAGAQMLVQNQQRWLAAQRIACGVQDPDAQLNPDQTSCLESQMRERVTEAQTAVEEKGGYTFQRVELIDAQAVTAEAAADSGLGEEAPPAITREIRFPRIDGNDSPQAARFNQLVAQQPQFRLEDQTEETVDYQIAYAGPEIISVRFNTYDYTLGAAHPNNGMRAVTVLMTTGQPLAASDVFRAGSGWENFVTRRAMQSLTAQFRDYDFTPPQADVRDSATKPHLWLVTEGGLVLLFPPYSFGGPHALGGAEVTIPWADLARYLNPNAPQPIRAPA